MAAARGWEARLQSSTIARPAGFQAHGILRRWQLGVGCGTPHLGVPQLAAWDDVSGLALKPRIADFIWFNWKHESDCIYLLAWETVHCLYCYTWPCSFRNSTTPHPPILKTDWILQYYHGAPNNFCLNSILKNPRRLAELSNTHFAQQEGCAVYEKIVRGKSSRVLWNANWRREVGLVLEGVTSCKEMEQTPPMTRKGGNKLIKSHGHCCCMRCHSYHPKGQRFSNWGLGPIFVICLVCRCGRECRSQSSIGFSIIF